MDKKSIDNFYNQVTRHIIHSELKNAQNVIGEYLSKVNDWELNNRYEQVCTSYKYLLHYMQEGIDDPQRHQLYNQLSAETWNIADQVRQKLIFSVKNYHFSVNLKPLIQRSLAEHLKQLENFTDDWAICQLMPDDDANIQRVLQRHEDNAQALFYTIWQSCHWSQQESEEAKLFLSSTLLPNDDRRLMVSAVTLNLISCFDSCKMMWLLQAATHHDIDTAQRALVGIFIVLNSYPSRLNYCPEIKARLDLLNDEIDLDHQLSRIWQLMLMSQNTAEIDKKMREEIIPEMIRNSQRMSKSKFDSEDLTEDSDLNPDWKMDLNDKALQEKLSEMNELQEEGADVYMATFKMLKDYTFFREIPNWFLPFNPNHSTLVKEYGLQKKQGHSPLSIILGQGNMCDSDKYSLCLTILNIPPSQRDGLLKQMDLPEVQEMINDNKNLSADNFSNDPWFVAKNYIQNLYRFFKLNPYKNEFNDIFLDLDLLNHKEDNSFIPFDRENLITIGNFYLKRKQYNKARNIFMYIDEIAEPDYEVYQKLGYCWQKEKLYSKAINYYETAELLKPNQLWTLQRIAECYLLEALYNEAIEYYKKINEILPDNKNNLLNYGFCLAESGCYEEAMQYFFKVNYMDNNNRKAKRYIAWYSFVMDKNEQAMKYYRQLTDDPATNANDFLNAGHVAWVMGDLKQAVTYYKRSKELMPANTSIREWITDDINTLLEKGILKEDIPLVLDMI